ncbi:PD-(D/E)XK nuclease family protein, partial [Patescibacteria group bacterium]|nr:PD-(D/E)XK nuclease family protein [Patescibacteria group bacterium]
DKIENGYEIIDYKTGKPKEKLGWDEKKQLVLYALACSQCFDPALNITKATYHYLENNSSISFEPNEKEKQKLINEVIDSVDKVRKSDFQASPGYHCQHCDFRDICQESAF